MVFCFGKRMGVFDKPLRIGEHRTAGRLFRKFGPIVARRAKYVVHLRFCKPLRHRRRRRRPLMRAQKRRIVRMAARAGFTFRFVHRRRIARCNHRSRFFNVTGRAVGLRRPRELNVYRCLPLQTIPFAWRPRRASRKRKHPRNTRCAQRKPRQPPHVLHPPTFPSRPCSETAECRHRMARTDSWTIRIDCSPACAYRPYRCCT